MIRILSLSALLALSCMMLAFSQPDAEGCAAVGRGDSTIRIAEESAIIVWDSTRKVEHFIRSAAFDTKSPDFGFLVPTPTKPILAEAEDRIFRDMEQWLRPRTVEQIRFNFAPALCCFHMVKSSMKGDSDKGVRILAEQKVGGFNATVLEADETESLSKWITEHGYSTDPELQSWLAPYVGAKWKITAFKILQDPKTGELATTRPVLMSFATERPFFPYREPAVKEGKQEQGSRLLRVFFVSDTRVDGKFANTPWHAQATWSDALTDDQRISVAVLSGIPFDEMIPKAWLTVFEDRASPRPGKDEVYFDSAADRSPIRPPDRIKYNDIWIPIDVLVIVGFMGISIVWLLRRGNVRSLKTWPGSDRAVQ